MAKKEWNLKRNKTPPPAPPRYDGEFDRGIERAVKILRAFGVETSQSCEGGAGHSYPEPTVEFHGNEAAGWHALAVCLNHGLPVRELRRVWSIEAGHVPVGPLWAITFRRRIAWIPPGKDLVGRINQHGYRWVEIIGRARRKPKSRGRTAP